MKLSTQEKQLKNVSLKIPKNKIIIFTGVSGSGKSSIVFDTITQEAGRQLNDTYDSFTCLFLPKYSRPEVDEIDNLSTVIVVNQKKIGGSARSTLGTITNINALFRVLFSCFATPSLGYANAYSFNDPSGMCSVCQGIGKTIALDVEKAVDLVNQVFAAVVFFDAKDIQRKLKNLQEVGIGYLTLGQPMDTLSGGEAQRLKLANELKTNGNIYILDEPTTGLHMSDVKNVIRIINNLVEKGNTVIVIEHNVDVIRNADWVIDLGPDGGRDGGEILFEGTVKELRESTTITGKYV